MVLSPSKQAEISLIAWAGVRLLSGGDHTNHHRKPQGEEYWNSAVTGAAKSFCGIFVFGEDMTEEWWLIAPRISKKECFCEFIGHEEWMTALQTALKILRRIVMLKICVSRFVAYQHQVYEEDGK